LDVVSTPGRLADVTWRPWLGVQRWLARYTDTAVVAVGRRTFERAVRRPAHNTIRRWASPIAKPSFVYSTAGERIRENIHFCARVPAETQCELRGAINRYRSRTSSAQPVRVENTEFEQLSLTVLSAHERGTGKLREPFARIVIRYSQIR